MVLKSVRTAERRVTAEAKNLNKEIILGTLQALGTIQYNAFIQQVNLWILQSLTQSVIYGYGLGRQSVQKELKLSLDDRINRLVSGPEEQILRMYFESGLQSWSEPLRYDISTLMVQLQRYIREEGLDPDKAAEHLRLVFKAKGYSGKTARNLKANFTTGFHLGYNGARYVESRFNPKVWGFRYRTAGDEKVRENHAAQNGVTLSRTDPFWNEWIPPNGYNCRCTIDVLTEEHQQVFPDYSVQPDEGFANNPFANFHGFNR